MSKITEVILSDGYLLKVLFDNKQAAIIDMKKKLNTARFSELRDEKVFSAGKTDGKSVHWPGGLSIAVSEIMEMVTKGEQVRGPSL
jgi:hypothetical protein